MTITTIGRAVGAAALLFATGAHAQVVNGEFSTGDFTGWTVGGDENSFAQVESDSTGQPVASFAGSGVGKLGQSLVTVAGQGYRLSFDAVGDFPFSRMAGPVQPGDFALGVSIDGVGYVITDITDDFETYTLDFTGDGVSALLFEIGAGPGRWRIDNVSVALLDGAVPEPATWAMMIAGFAMIGTMTRRRRTVLA